ncbi:MAG: hypothetical protein AAGA93_01755 [Actinomycetota bacterium]
MTEPSDQPIESVPPTGPSPDVETDAVANPYCTGVPPVRCNPSLEELYHYMDGFLDEGRAAEVRQRLADCRGCGEIYDVQTQFRRLIEQRCQTELPPDLKDKVFGAIAEISLGPARPDRPDRSS